MRRVISVDEIIDSTKWVQSFVWDPSKDKFYQYLDKSVKLRKLAKDYGKSMGDIMKEIANRIQVLQWLRSRNIRNYIEISTVFSQYHSDPEGVLSKIRVEAMSKSVFEKEDERDEDGSLMVEPSTGE